MIPQEFPAIISLIIKMLTILGFVIYAVFAAVMVRQEHLMADVLEEGFEPVLRSLTYIDLFASFLVIIIALVFL
jgi:hypothetical protein